MCRLNRNPGFCDLIDLTFTASARTLRLARELANVQNKEVRRTNNLESWQKQLETET